MKYLFVVMAGSIGVLPDNWTFVKRKPRLEEEAGGGARWSKEQGGREGAENGVDYQVWSSVQAIFPARDIRYHSRGGGERKMT